VEGQGAAMVMGGIGEVHQGILDLGIRGTFSHPDTGVTVFTDPDGEDTDRIGEAITLIMVIMKVILIPAMDTRIPSRSELRFTIPVELSLSSIYEL